MAAIWHHPEYGEFTHSGSAWVGALHAPGFDVCAYAPEEEEPPTGQYELAIDADSDADLPSPGMLAVVERLLANQTRLPSLIAETVWGSGVSELEDAFGWDGLPPPVDASDLCRRGLRLFQIRIRDRVAGCSGPVAELNFLAAYDRSHDLGVLTDGRTLVGIGGVSDVRPL